MSKLFLSFIIGAASIALNAQQPMIPAELGTIPLTADDATRSNQINYGLTVSTAIDDNATDPASVGSGEMNVLSSIRPEAKLILNRTRFTSLLFYGPAFTYSSKIDSYNSTAQAAGADVEYFFTKRLYLNFHSTFSLTTNAYDKLQGDSQLPSVGILNQGNTSALGADVRDRTGQAQANLVYRLGRHTSVGLGGAFNDLQYQGNAANPTTAQASLDSRSWSGNAFYSHELTERYSLGIQYTAQQLSSTGPTGQFDSLSHQVLGVLSLAVRPTIKLSLFAGPERSNLDDRFLRGTFVAAASLSQSSFAGGADLSWEGQHNGMKASFIQQVNDSGLNGQGSMLVRTVTADIQHQIGPRLRLKIFGNYVSNSQLDPVSTTYIANAASAGIGFEKVLTPHIAINLLAQRQQFIGGAQVPFFGYQQRSHEIGTISIAYTFARPLGR